jgi:hypothetical protein
MTSTTSNTLRRLLRLSPSRAELVDGAFLAVLSTLALLGFRSTYDGAGYLLVGVAGLLLGLLLGHLANVLRVPVYLVVPAAAAVFFVLGGALTLRGLLPTPGALHGLADTSVHGWKDLLTTLPPVDGAGPLLALPYLLGLVGGLAGTLLARRLRAGFAPAAAPVLLLAAVILLGTDTPAARLVQGVLFGVLALCWAAVRTHRQRPPVQNGAGGIARLATAGGLLTAAALGAVVLGPGLPGGTAAAADRTVLRNYVEPPFDIRDYPSPLAGFRRYVKGAPLTQYEKRLFTVSGLPAGTRVRLAVLTGYDGAVWAAGPSTGPRDSFQKVGRVIAQDGATGTPVEFTVTVDQYADVWLPDAGTVTGVAFGGARGDGHADHFRYNLDTGAGVVPDRLAAGDTVTIRAVLPPAPGNATPAAEPTVAADKVGPVRTTATKWAGAAEDPWQRIAAVAARLKQDGAYSDGDGGEQRYLPGHGAWRLTTFFTGPQPVGDDEQYAAAFALLVNQLGYPARVVLGAKPGQDGVVRGRDVHAWVEVRLTGGDWRPIYTDAFMPDTTKHPQQQPPKDPQDSGGVVVPPPSTQRPPTALLVDSQADSRVTVKAPGAGAGWHLPGWLVTAATWTGPPILAVLAWCALLVGVKARRRALRRSRGPAAQRIGRGWREILDHSRDLGAPAPVGATRREQAAALERWGLAPLAASTDALVFGRAEPTDAAVGAYWRQVLATRAAMSGSVGRRRRLCAAVSPVSLLPHRPPRQPATPSRVRLRVGVGV